MATSEKKHGGFLRTNPFMVDKKVIYWKLDDYCNNTTMMLQGLLESVIQHPSTNFSSAL